MLDVTTADPSSIDISDVQVRQDAHAYLAGAVRRTGLKSPAQQAQKDYPDMQLVMARIAYFVTDRPYNVFSEKPLLDSMVDAGLQAMFLPNLDGSQRVTRFFQAVLARGSELLGMQFVASTGFWNPFSGIPLGSWVLAHPDFRISHDEALPHQPPANFRELLLRSVVEPRELAGMGSSPALALAYQR